MSSLRSPFRLGCRGVLTTLIALMLMVSLVGPGASLALADSPEPEPELESVSSDGDLETVEVDIDDDLEDLLENAETNDLETVELIVRFEPAPVTDVPEDDVEDVLEEHAEETQAEIHEYANGDSDAEVRTEFWLANAVLLEVDPSTVDLAALANIDEVTAIHENFEISSPEPEIDLEPVTAETLEDETEASEGHGSDEPENGYTTTYGIAAINAPNVWDRYDTQGAGVTVAVLDTGIDADHPDLELYTDDPDDPTYPGGWAEFDERGERVPGSVPSDHGSHGTHVSGTVAGGNEIGVHIGVAPDVDLLHGQVLGEETGTFAQMLAGMEWAVKQEADVVSMSFGATGTFDALIRPIQHIEQSGAVPVAAIGNDGPDVSGSPANVYDALAIGAVDQDGQVASFSGGGEISSDDWREPPAHWPDSYLTPDLVAPGVNVGSTVPGGYGYSSGTSMAAPHVSGAIALMIAVNGNLTPAEIESALVETAEKPADAPTEKDDRYGSGSIDVLAATDSIAGTGETAATTETPPTEASEQDGLPGFGLVAGLAGVILSVLALRRYNC